MVMFDLTVGGKLKSKKSPVSTSVGARESSMLVFLSSTNNCEPLVRKLAAADRLLVVSIPSNVDSSVSESKLNFDDVAV